LALASSRFFPALVEPAGGRALAALVQRAGKIDAEALMVERAG
jgi:hypothetical protein